MTEYTTEKRNKKIVSINNDFEEIDYMYRNVSIENLSDKELQELDNAVSKTWLLLARIH
ncbi:unnamed protein product [marine sediment metagenome]|uniref:Uncharacterized protein n=1 Tax=marine sediment metagenome TaxID=412755 RepID=X1BEV5_9ZZZZ